MGRGRNESGKKKIEVELWGRMSELIQRLEWGHYRVVVKNCQLPGDGQPRKLNSQGGRPDRHDGEERHGIACRGTAREQVEPRAGL